MDREFKVWLEGNSPPTRTRHARNAHAAAEEFCEEDFETPNECVVFVQDILSGEVERFDMEAEVIRHFSAMGQFFDGKPPPVCYICDAIDDPLSGEELKIRAINHVEAAKAYADAGGFRNTNQSLLVKVEGPNSADPPHKVEVTCSYRGDVALFTGHDHGVYQEDE